MAPVDMLRESDDGVRLFAAVFVPEPIAAQAAALRAEIERARWVPMENLHVTLRFFGEVDGADAAALIEGLAAVRASAFGARLAGVGTFGRPARTLWAGLEPAASWIRLAAAIAAVPAPPVDPPRRHAAFHAHLTLARLREPPPHRIRRFADRHRDLESDPFDVRSFSLYRSRLGPKGAKYEELERFPLDSE